jgi:hypothetical protein
MNDLSNNTVSTTDLSRRSGVSWRTLLIAGTVALVGGGALGGWLIWEYVRPIAPVAETAVPAPSGLVPAAQPRPTLAASPALPPAPLTATQEATLATRISLLEDRLARISVTADGASGNAAKAEAMLLALAARRALDRGLPLGVLEGQLRLRFGETQPVAVDAIIAAARAPTTDDELIRQLTALRGDLDIVPDASLLDRMRSAVDSLIVIRPSDSPSPTVNNRFQRAIRALERGRIDLAIIEVEAMPGAGSTSVAGWLRRARLRNDAVRALDLIESAAIVEQPSTPPPAAPVQPAPVRRR